MTALHSTINRFTTPAFLIAFNLAFGSTLISIATAHLGMPVAAWGFWYLSLLGFVVVLILGTAILIGMAADAIAKRISAFQPETMATGSPITSP